MMNSNPWYSQVNPRGSSFLFPLPNNIRSLSSKRSFIAGLILLMDGLACMVNASVATAFGAVKHYIVSPFFNTHWITCIYVLTGITLMLVETKRLNYFLFLGSTLTVITFCLGAGLFVADVININTVSGIQPDHFRGGDMGFNEFHRVSSISYNAIDLLCNTIAVIMAGVALYEMKSTTSRYFAYVGGRSWAITAVGFTISALSVAKLITYIVELSWLQTDETAYYFVNYTFDEPGWQLVLFVTGILTMLVGIMGSRILLHTSMALNIISYHPTVQFLWIDYRWITQVHFSEYFREISPFLTRILAANMTISTLTIVATAAAVVMLTLKLAANEVQMFQINISVDRGLKKILCSLPVVLILAGGLFLASDVFHGTERTFFRFFYPTEQKLPFLLVPAGILCLFALLRDSSIRYLLIPLAFVLLLQCAQFTLFHIAAYIYLAKNMYFVNSFCDMFHFTQHGCNYQVELMGSFLHFCEAVLATAVLFISVVGAVIIGRMMGLQAVREMTRTTAKPQSSRIRLHQVIILVLGIAQLLLATAIPPLVAIFSFHHEKGYTSHPLFMLHQTINLTCYLVPYCIISVTQMLWARGLHNFPLRIIALMGLHAVRIIDIIMHLDYRNIANNFALGTLFLFTGELLSLTISYWSIIECGFIMDMATSNALPDFDFANADEGVENGDASAAGENDSGYHDYDVIEPVSQPSASSTLTTPIQPLVQDANSGEVVMDVPKPTGFPRSNSPNVSEPYWSLDRPSNSTHAARHHTALQ